MNELSHKKILVVDDDADTRELLRFALEECGADVVMAQSVTPRQVDPIEIEKSSAISTDQTD